MRTTVFFDLDGTLIDTSERHYRVYRDILDCQGRPNALSKRDFWNHKRCGRKTVELLGDNCPEDFVRAFMGEWLERIEQREYLGYDCLFDESVKTLSALKDKAVLILVTLRNNKENLLWELNRFGLAGYFSEIAAGSPIRLKDKTTLISGFIDDYSNEDSFIILGDSETDVSTGKKLGILSGAATYGIRSKEFLERLEPDFYFDDPSEVITILELIGYEL